MLMLRFGEQGNHRRSASAAEYGVSNSWVKAGRLAPSITHDVYKNPHPLYRRIFLQQIQDVPDAPLCCAIHARIAVSMHLHHQNGERQTYQADTAAAMPSKYKSAMRKHKQHGNQAQHSHLLIASVAKCLKFALQ